MYRREVLVYLLLGNSYAIMTKRNRIQIEYDNNAASAKTSTNKYDKVAILRDLTEYIASLVMRLITKMLKYIFYNISIYIYIYI